MPIATLLSAPLVADPFGPALPAPRGPLSEFLADSLVRAPHSLRSPAVGVDWGPTQAEDRALALYLCYELHYRGFAGVDDGWEWEPTLLDLRAQLEDAFLSSLIAEVGSPRTCRDVEAELAALVEAPDGPSFTSYLAEHASLGEFREFVIHRSAYQLKEADPHTWAVPRLTGESKAALVSIQYDEYGRGREDRAHAHVFARTMKALELDPTYGAYLDRIPAPTLDTVNLVSMFGLHRRWRGALVGHLAVLEMSSVVPNAAYGDGLRRLGYGIEATQFYDLHVIEDKRHQVTASTRLAGGLARSHPELGPDIGFGARAIIAVENHFSRHLLASWAAGQSSLRGT